MSENNNGPMLGSAQQESIERDNNGGHTVTHLLANGGKSVTKVPGPAVSNPSATAAVANSQNTGHVQGA